MKNVTISMDDELAHLTRVAAAKAGKSVSKFLAEAAREKIAGDARGHAPDRNVQLDAIERFLAGPPLNISGDGRMPRAEERNLRGWQSGIR
ncbi:hypothetical protein [Mesorhizobium marinum]|uniref:Ribbon-helix-helix protein, CopG family n=1 Tax=Mesorhizobium marinum TaxID=3228790 RepID=A0ABV3QU86_9HYPH